MSTQNTRGRLFRLLATAAMFVAGGTTQVHAADFAVLNTNDMGPGSLRQAIIAANMNPGADTIVFNFMPSTARTITLSSGQLTITDDLTISGPSNPAGVEVRGNNTFTIFVISGATVTIDALTISGGGDPDEDVAGGGIANLGNLTILSSTISGNRAGDGGGIANDGTMTIINSTISSNTTFGQAGGAGGGIFNRGTLTLENATISNNAAVAPGLGGGVYNQGMLEMSDTIVANSTLGGDCVSAALPGVNVTDNGFNIVEEGGCISSPSSRMGDPNLGPLANNGGPTQTHAPLPGSIALFSGNCSGLTVLVDQRGVGRPQGNSCDIGSVELETACSVDTDLDGVGELCDNCPGISNPNQDDADQDSAGDECDPCPLDSMDDSDNDGVCDSEDICPGADDTIDSDGDTVPDGCDKCPGGNDLNDPDGDGVPKDCDQCPGFPDSIDSDQDGVPNGCDKCPDGDDATDTDADGTPDACDPCAGGDGSRDTDADGDFGLDDFAVLIDCIKPNPPSEPNGCGCFNYDADDDVDLADAAVALREFRPLDGCVIEGQFYAPGEVDAAPNICRSCQPQVSTSEWTPRSEGTVCREGSGDACDPDEVCDGTTARCPANTVLGQETICREADGDCDRPERCMGSPGQSCPPDGVRSSSFECRASAGDCDAPETCDGETKDCPADLVASAETECRPKDGDCDIAEICDGESRECPADSFASAGEPCRSEVAGGCDIEEVCDGETKDCPPDEFAPKGTVCRSIKGECDLEEEVCSGNSASCPFDQNNYGTNGLVCREQYANCDVAEYCDQNDPGYPDCPFDEWAPAGTVCRDINPDDGANFQACEAVEECSGDFPLCPPDGSLPPGTSCTRGNGTDGVCTIVIAQGSFDGKCIEAGTVQNGDACRFDSDCESDNCVETWDRSFLCAPAGEVGFGGTCDGLSLVPEGDPNGRECTGEGSDRLWCCNGMSSAKTGEEGTCQQCCRNDDGPQSGGNGGTGKGIIGCEEESSNDQCCDGRCTDFDADPYNCGECGLNCYDYVDGACRQEVVECRIPGECVYETPCDDATQSCTSDCDVCTALGTDCTGCEGEYSCYTLILTDGTLCGECEEDNDCDAGQACYSGCGGGFGNIFCFNPSQCRESINDDSCGG